MRLLNSAEFNPGKLRRGAGPIASEELLDFARTNPAALLTELGSGG